jgi:hypothetical protein
MLGRDAEFVYVALQWDPRLVTLPAGELIPIACQYPGVGGPREEVLGCGSLHSLGRRLWGLPDLLESVKRVGSVGA